MASKQYNDAMEYIAKYAAKYAAPDDVLFEFDYDDPELEATVKVPVSVGEYYINAQAVEDKLAKETIECPYCMGDLDCSECVNRGVVSRPSNVLDYIALLRKVTRNRWQQSGGEGMLASDVIIDWNDAIRSARKLYPDG